MNSELVKRRTFIAGAVGVAGVGLAAVVGSQTETGRKLFGAIFSSDSPAVNVDDSLNRDQQVAIPIGDPALNVTKARSIARSARLSTDIKGLWVGTDDPRAPSPISFVDLSDPTAIRFRDYGLSTTNLKLGVVNSLADHTVAGLFAAGDRFKGDPAIKTGIVHFDYQTEKWTQSTDDKSGLPPFMNDPFYTVHLSSNKAYAGGEGGIIQLDLSKNNGWERIAPLVEQIDQRKVHALWADDQRMIVGLLNQGVQYFEWNSTINNYSRKAFFSIKGNKDALHSDSTRVVSRLYDNIFAVGTDPGLSILTINDKVSLEKSNFLPDLDKYGVFGATMDSRGRWHIAAQNGGWEQLSGGSWRKIHPYPSFGVVTLPAGYFRDRESVVYATANGLVFDNVSTSSS